MTLREYVENLKKLVRAYGDYKVVYASDDEGNGYQEVYYAPSVGFYHNGEFRAADLETQKKIEGAHGKEKSAVCIN